MVAQGMLTGDISSIIRSVSVAAVPALLGIILHEMAHGWAASQCGDPTARQMGRLTLNPLPHIDPMGLLTFVLTSMSGLFVFGWAKPVPVNPRYFRSPARDMMIVALAGPLTNFALAAGFALLLRALLGLFPSAYYADNGVYVFFAAMLYAGVTINFGLGWLNLLPVPPLDGSKVLAYFLPPRLGWQYMRLERYGFLILLGLIFLGALGAVLGPLVVFSTEAVFTILGL